LIHETLGLPSNEDIDEILILRLSTSVLSRRDGFLTLALSPSDRALGRDGSGGPETDGWNQKDATVEADST
jgi:hypothetical protein